MKLDLDDYKSETVRNILTSILYEFGVDVNVKGAGKDRKRAKLKVVGSNDDKAAVRKKARLEQRVAQESDDTGSRKPGPDEGARTQNYQQGPGEEPKPALHVVKSHPTQVTIEELLKYYKHKGVVGEEKNCILQTLCAVNGLSFGLEGNSGSGKTFLVDALIDLLPREKVYELGLSSEQAAFNDSNSINKCSFIYIPEIQKAMNNSKNRASSIIELIKNLTEGKDASRIVTVSRGEVAEYRIKAGITLIYTLAIENCFKKDNETSRRFIRLMTDISPAHIDEVMAYKAEERCSVKNERCLSKDGIERIRAHINNCIRMPKLQYFDPFSLALNEYIPATPKTIGFVDHYYGLLNASAKFHHKNRIFTGDALVLDFEDHYLIHALYYNEFCKSLSDLNEDSFGSSEQHKIMKPSDMDWGKLWIEGVRKMGEQLPSLADGWVAKQMKGNSIRVYDVPSQKYDEIRVVDGV